MFILYGSIACKFTKLESTYRTIRASSYVEVGGMCVHESTQDNVNVYSTLQKLGYT